MATNLNIDEKLLNEALSLSGKRTKRETVNEALSEYIQHRKQSKIVQFFGKIDFDPTYDYKKQRKSR
ncbi:MAG: type II toxin-antitoxin system VapB family antitoxin [Candidatus Obscuribacterales bacterium]|nr:type II toxin-antitoxin system VapB family antitoxin [Candidatus Obscuribacterales bacterium]